MKKLFRENLTLQLYLKLMPAQLLSVLSVAVCSFISIAVIGNCLDENALASANLIGGFINFSSIISILITSGLIFLMNLSICKNAYKREAVFSTSVVFAAVCGIVFFVACIAFPKQISTLLNADSNTLPLCINYLRGLSFGFFAAFLISIFNSIFQINSKSKKVIISMIILAVSNIALITVFLVVLKLNIFFAGLSASISQYLSLSYLIYSYIKERYPKIVFSDFSRKILKQLTVIGFTQSSVIIFSTLKDIYFNCVASTVGGVVNLSARAAINGIDAITYSLFYQALCIVTMMVSAIYINAEDRGGLRKYIKTTAIITFTIASCLWGIMFFAAPLSAKLFNTADISYTIWAQRVFSFAYFGYLFNIMIIKLFGNLKKIKEVNILSAFSFIIIPVITTTVLSFYFGDKGFWYSITISEFLGLFITFLYIIFYNKRLPGSTDEILCLKKDFGVASENTFTFQITNQTGVEHAYSNIIDFCMEKGIDKKTAFNCGLCFEEIGTNIIEHGDFSKKNTIDVSVIYNDNNMKLIIRDNCKPFDPKKRFSQLDDNSPTKCIGIRIVMQMAKDVEYKTIYGLNILTITI